jgi:hypothetical protein
LGLKYRLRTEVPVRPHFARPLALVMTLAWATSAAADAAVTFNFQTSIGFVDRSEAQAAFGLNYGQMQKRASQVVFSAVQTVTLAVNCASGPPRQAVMEISATVDFTIVPTKGSFDGFALAGVHDVLIADPPPATVICGGPGSLGGQIAAVRRLSASLGGQSAVLLEEH